VLTQLNSPPTHSRPSWAPGLAGLAFGLAILTALSGCPSKQVRTAPFRARPDSTAAGDLRGPFDGKVVDGANGRPVAGAMVYATWTLENGYGVARPSGFREFVTSTDANGTYEIPTIDATPSARSGKSPAARLTSFQLVIYKRGFVGYRSDRRFADLATRHDFAQRHNRVELERWRSDYSHARHVRYIGGGPAIASLTGWEAEEAAAELNGGAAIKITSDLSPRGSSQLVAAQLLSVDEVKAITGYDGAFETGPLGDDPDTTAYSSQHFKALGRPETYDIAVRLWLLTPGKAQERYGQLVDTLPGVEEVDEIANRSMRAEEGNIRGVGFLDGNRGMVALVTCGETQCSSIDEVVAIARTMFANAKKLWPDDGGGK
jgi:hypothetical protein